MNNMDIDLRTVAKDITLCTNRFCKDKCKRYCLNWKPSTMQSYINPPTEFTIDGDIKPCRIRMEDK